MVMLEIIGVIYLAAHFFDGTLSAFIGLLRFVGTVSAYIAWGLWVATKWLWQTARKRSQPQSIVVKLLPFDRGLPLGLDRDYL